jgi:uncharacterized membrane protein
LKTTVKKPFNIFHWFVLGVFCGIGLGIIIGLILSALGLVNTEWPNGPPDWEIIKWFAYRAAFLCALYGAVIGGVVGFMIGLVRSNRQQD